MEIFEILHLDKETARFGTNYIFYMFWVMRSQTPLRFSFGQQTSGGTQQTIYARIDSRLMCMDKIETCTTPMVGPVPGDSYYQSLSRLHPRDILQVGSGLAKIIQIGSACRIRYWPEVSGPMKKWLLKISALKTNAAKQDKDGRICPAKEDQKQGKGNERGNKNCFRIIAEDKSRS